jgi:hypothetical protein
MRQEFRVNHGPSWDQLIKRYNLLTLQTDENRLRTGKTTRVRRPTPSAISLRFVEAPGVEPFARARKFFRYHEDLRPKRRVFTRFGSGVSYRFKPARTDEVRSV